MADIAQLGIAVDSSQAERGALSLQKLSGAARMAEQATQGTASGSRAAAQANAAVASSADVAAASLTRQAGAARQAAVAVNDNVRRMGGSMSGLAAQVQDIGVTAAMGMNPMIIGLQQGTQIAGQMEMAMQNGGSAASVFGQALSSLLSPVSLLSIGLTILLAAGLQMVDWPAAAAWALDMLANNLEAIAPYAVAAAGALALIYAPAMVTGLVSIIALLARISVAALATAASFTTAWLAAMGPVGILIAGIAAVATAAFLLRDEIKTAVGVDVVGIMKDAGNFIINSFEMVFSDISFMWANFPDIFAVAATGAVNSMISAVNEMVKTAAAGIDLLIGIANKIPGVDISPVGDPGDLISPISDGGAAQRLAGANQGQLAEYERIMGQDRLGQFGEAIGAGASAASGKLKELSDWMTTVDEKDKKKRGGGKTDAEHYQDIVDGADRRIASLLAEQSALGLTEEAAAALRYEQDLLNQAQQKGIELTPVQAGYMRMLAETMAGIEAATKKAKEAMDFAKDLTRGFVNDFRSGLEQGKSIWESFGQAAMGVLDKITDKLLNDVLDAIFQVNKAGAGGGGGGIMGFLGSMFGGGGGGTNWGALSSSGKYLFAEGGFTGPGAKYEPAGVVHKGEYVFSAAATRALGIGNLNRMHRSAKGYAEGGYVGPSVPRMQAPANGNSGGGLKVDIGVSMDENGNLQAYVRNVVQSEGEQVAVRVVQQNNQAMANYKQNGGN